MGQEAAQDPALEFVPTISFRACKAPVVATNTFVMEELVGVMINGCKIHVPRRRRPAPIGRLDQGKTFSVLIGRVT